MEPLRTAKVSRKEFLIYLGAAVVALIGVGPLIEILSGKHQTNPLLKQGTKYQPIAQKNQPDGYAGLDNKGKLPLSLLPASVSLSSSLEALGNVHITSPVNNQVLTYNTATNKWINQSVALTEKDRVTTSSPTNASDSAAGGDLAGAYPNPTVAKLDGVAISGTPSGGQVLTATSATAAAWQAPTTIPGVPVVQAIPFAFNTPDILTGTALYTPTVGDILMDFWIEIDTPWNGITPSGDIGTFDASGTQSGFFREWGNGVLDMTVADRTLATDFSNLLRANIGSSGALIEAVGYSGVAANMITANPNAHLIPNAVSAGARLLPSKFATNTPIRFIVTQDGSSSGANPGATQGSGTLYLVTVTPRTTGSSTTTSPVTPTVPTVTPSTVATVATIAAQSTTVGKEIHRLKIFNNRLYLAYGDYNANTGPIEAISLDLANPANPPSAEASFTTEETWTMRTFNSSLYVPYVDPQGSGQPQSNTAVATAYNTWAITNVAPLIEHCYDVAVTSAGWFLFGASHINESSPGNGGVATIWQSTDNGAHWTTPVTIVGTSGFTRFYMAVTFGEKIVAMTQDPSNSSLNQRWDFDGTSWSMTGSNSQQLTEASVPFSYRGTAFYIGMPGTNQHLNSSAAALNVICAPADQSRVSVIAATLPTLACFDFAVSSDGQKGYLLGSGNSVWRGDTVGNWTQILTLSTSTQRSIAVDDTHGYLYFGTTDSKVIRTPIPT